MAGDKLGITGQKSSLVDEVFRLMDRSAVEWVVFENVYFMLHLKNGSGIQHLISKLEQRGMAWAYRVLNTYWFGIPQRRRRLFLVASPQHDPRPVLLSDDFHVQPAIPDVSLDRPIGFFWTEGRSGVGLTPDAIPPLKAGSGLGIPSAPAVLFPDGKVETPTIEEAERLQGFPAKWTQAAEEVYGRQRWKLVGNAVSVPVSRWIGQRLKCPVPYESSRDEPLLAGEPWPPSAWGKDGARFRSRASENPSASTVPSLAAFARRPWRPLSQRALAGFIARARASTLRYPAGFLDALDAQLARLR
jgi:DNA (cytosine-5)-methyltransferase 1